MKYPRCLECQSYIAYFNQPLSGAWSEKFLEFPLISSNYEKILWKPMILEPIHRLDTRLVRNQNSGVQFPKKSVSFLGVTLTGRVFRGFRPSDRLLASFPRPAASFGIHKGSVPERVPMQ